MQNADRELKAIAIGIIESNADDGAPETFYSVEGSLGGKLAVNGIADASFSLGTSSFSIKYTGQIFRYAFDSLGSLLGLSGRLSGLPEEMRFSGYGLTRTANAKK